MTALAWFYLGVVGVAWLVVNAIEGELLSEFESPGQWVSQIVGIIICGAVVITRAVGRLRGAHLTVVAIVFQISISYVIAFNTYWGAFEGLGVEDLNGDRIGMSLVGAWMFGCAVLMPTRPTHSVASLLLSATAIPVVYLLMAQQGAAPMPAALPFFTIFVLPYLIVAVVAWMAARIVFQLARDARHARALGSYHLEERIGEGAMGEVWRANHAMLARPAAIKIIKPATLAGDEQWQNAITRFEREARITASLESTHTVRLYDFGRRNDGMLYYAMELLEGVDLQTMVDDYGPLHPERVVHLLLQACGSLTEAHRRGLVHRDIKPANLFVCRWAFEYDFIKVLDFGLARADPRSELGSDVAATHADVIVGTPAYIAPETVLGQVEPDERADIYAVGCVAYFLLTGKPVFDASTVVEVVAAHVGIAPSAPSEHAGTLPEGLDELVLSCLAKDPDERMPTVDELHRRPSDLVIESPWTPARAESWWHEHASELGAH